MDKTQSLQPENKGRSEDTFHFKIPVTKIYNIFLLDGIDDDEDDEDDIIIWKNSVVLMT
jgi:hypothetical protein